MDLELGSSGRAVNQPLSGSPAPSFQHILPLFQTTREVLSSKSHSAWERPEVAFQVTLARSWGSLRGWRADCCKVPISDRGMRHNTQNLSEVKYLGSLWVNGARACRNDCRKCVERQELKGHGYKEKPRLKK